MLKRLALLSVPLGFVLALLPATGFAAVRPQGYQSDASFASSYSKHAITNTLATTQRTSCYTPEVPFFTVQTGEGYSGMSPCNSAATTGENLGPYATQAGSNFGYPATTPMLVKNHAESHVIADPTNPSHVIGSSKWFVSAEGYNHLLGFYESWDGGKTFPVQGHVPGYEGWADNTDPVGAFDGYGDYYSLVLGYEFYYNADGSHNFQTNNNKTPNGVLPAEVIAISVRPHGATSANQWNTTQNGAPDYIAAYSPKGQEPDKQWITIDDNPASPNYNTIYAMWVVFDGLQSKPFWSTAKALPGGTHTPWSTPQILPTTSSTASDTYLLPHVAGDGTVYTTVSNFPSKQGFSRTTTFIDYSTDGGKTFQGPLTVTPTVNSLLAPYCCYSNTNTRSGITDSFAIGPRAAGNGRYPLYVTWEDYTGGFANIYITASYDGGATWTAAALVNDNTSPNVDEFQPNLATAANGTVSVAFYDRRLACAAAGTREATLQGLALDTNNPNYSGSLPPYGVTNYCANTAIQFYSATLAPIGQNIRLSAHSFDPELNSDLFACACEVTQGFIGDYFGNAAAGASEVTTSVSTIDDGTNPRHFQQQLVTTIAVPSA